MQLVHQIVAAIRFVFKKSCSTVLQVLLNKIFDYDTKCVKMHKSRRKNCRMLIYTNCLGLCYNKKGYYRENNLLKGGIVMNEAQYDYKDICNYIIARAEKSKHSVTNLQLQKILYYVQGYFLREFEVPAFDAEIEAWQYGPVVPEAYYDFCIYGRNYITSEDTDNALGKIESKEHKKLIDKVITACTKMSVGDLIDKTHNETPWKNKIQLKDKIPLDVISDYFTENNPLEI